MLRPILSHIAIQLLSSPTECTWHEALAAFWALPSWCHAALGPATLPQYAPPGGIHSSPAAALPASPSPRQMRPLERRHVSRLRAKRPGSTSTLQVGVPAGLLALHPAAGSAEGFSRLGRYQALGVCELSIGKGEPGQGSVCRPTLVTYHAGAYMAPICCRDAQWLEACHRAGGAGSALHAPQGKATPLPSPYLVDGRALGAMAALLQPGTAI